MGRPRKAAADSVPPAAKPGTRKRGRPPKRSGKKPTRRADPLATDSAKSADSEKPGGDIAGGRGEVAVLDESRGRTTNSDLRMLERAIRRRWGTRPEVMDALLSKAARLGLSSDDPRVVFGALRCHLQAEAQNQADELKQIPDQLTVSHVNAPLTADGQRTAILRAIAAEREKRVVRRGRKRVSPVDGPAGRGSTG